MKAKRLSKKVQQDRITTLPQPIVESILCLLPIEEAARTCILSREWRYTWTAIPKLVFNTSTVSKRTTEMNGPSDLEQKSSMASAWENMDVLRCKLFYAIHQVLLLHQGPIYEFALSMNELYSIKTTYNCFEIDQIILHLLRSHTIKKLTLKLLNDDLLYKLPLSVFSFHHLTDLHLESCTIDHKPIFNGFGSLTSLFMSNITISKEALLHLLSNCPSLTRLSLLMHDNQLLDYEQFITITELFKCLPVIEHLTTSGYLIRDFILDSVQLQKMIHLKYFCLEEMGFVCSDELSFLAVLIKFSPNLEKIKLEIDVFDCYDDDDADEIASVVLKEYSDVWLEHLNELEIDCFRNYKPELELLKIILAKSPELKQVKLTTTMSVDEDELLKILSRTPHAPQVEIIIN